MESTYGRPEYSFPPEEQVLATACKTLREWLSQGARPVVRGWRMGKAQELLHHLLDAGFDVVMEDGAYRIAETYQQAGVEFSGEFGILDAGWPEGQVLICPPGPKVAASLSRFKGKRSMELTGWAVSNGHRWGRPADASLPYSDHADFNDLIGYVQAVQPKRVYTVFGFADLAARLREMGYAAAHLGKGATAGDQAFQMPLL
jgi:Cft2 family RNA processing exonuclease